MTPSEKAKRVEAAARAVLDDYAKRHRMPVKASALRAALALPVEEPKTPPTYGCFRHHGKHAWIAQGAMWICDCGVCFHRQTDHTQDNGAPRVRGIDISEARYLDDGQGHRYDCRCIQKGGTICTCEETVTLREEKGDG